MTSCGSANTPFTQPGYGGHNPQFEHQQSYDCQQGARPEYAYSSNQQEQQAPHGGGGFGEALNMAGGFLGSALEKGSRSGGMAGKMMGKAGQFLAQAQAKY